MGAAIVGRGEAGVAMQQHNRDMFPSEATVALFEAVRPLVVHEKIDKAFLQHEDAAKKHKKTYHNFGRAALALITLAALFTVAEALILPEFAGATELSAAMAFAGAFGVVLQLYILLTAQKKKWLLNRFAAERIRAIKFRAYCVAEGAQDAADLQRRTDAFHTAALAQLENELNAGASAYETFSPTATLRTTEKSLPEVQAPANASLTAMAREAYVELRIRYQRMFVADQLSRLRQGKRAADTLADLLYLAGAIVVVATLVLKFMHHDTHYWDFAAVTLFVGGLSIAILANASLAEESQRRYERYGDDIQDLEAGVAQGRFSMREMSDEMEHLALGELEVFCRAASEISYRL